MPPPANAFTRRPPAAAVWSLALAAGLLGFGPRSVEARPSPTASARLDLPAPVAINRGAGRGDLLLVTLRLEDGEKLLFAIDTGANLTVLDKSLEPKLGRPIRTRRIHTFYGVHRGNIYAAPTLYLGDTALQTGPQVVTTDLGQWFPYPGRPLRGILGLDCLKHYCLQLDFGAEEIRFLDPDRLPTTGLGRPYPLRRAWFTGLLIARENPAGIPGVRSTIDTGNNGDGLLSAHLMRRALRAHRATLTNNAVHFPAVIVDGVTYTNVSLGQAQHRNFTGLSFLARHRVTFDLPHRKMYLQPISAGPLTDQLGSTNAPDVTLGWWSEDDSVTAPANPAELADRILSPPNLHPAEVPPSVVWWVRQNPDFRRLRIPVGPPAARLSVLQLPPGDYHAQPTSRVELKHGEPGTLSAFLVPQHRHPATPLPERGIVLLLHGYDSQKEMMSLWAYALAEAGYRAILVDLRGHGESTGQLVSYGRYEIADLTQVLDSLPAPGNREEVGVLGVGYGADLALHWAARDPRVGSVVAIAPYDQPVRAFARMAHQNSASIPAQALVQALNLAATRLGIRWSDWSGEAALRQLRTPVLLIGGGKDTISTPDDLKALEHAAPPGSKTLVVPDANDQAIGFWFRDLAKPVTTWFQAHLTEPSGAQAGQRPAASSAGE